MKIVSRFMAFPMWARVAAATVGVVIVLGAVAIPVAAVAVDAQHRLEIEVEQAASEQRAAAAAAEALAEARGSGARLNAGFDGLTTSLAAAVHSDAAAAFEAARVELAFAIAGGDLEEVSAAVTALTEALDGLVASAGAQADALITASPLAGPSRDALAQAVADLETADDVTAALARVKTASDAVVTAQKAGKAAADKAAADAAAKRAAEAEADDSSWGDPSGEEPSGGTGSAEHPYDPGITGMFPGDRPTCGDNPAGQVVTFSFGWEAREGNTVDISYAITDGDYQATGGFTQIVSGAGPTGSVSIPVACPVGSTGTYNYVTVKAVANNPNGSAAAFYWGL